MALLENDQAIQANYLSFMIVDAIVMKKRTSRTFAVISRGKLTKNGEFYRVLNLL